jgi:hypothetical protein
MWGCISAVESGQGPELAELDSSSEYRCVDGIFGRCAYFEPHSAGVFAEPSPGGFVQITDPWEYLKR